MWKLVVGILQEEWKAESQSSHPEGASSDITTRAKDDTLWLTLLLIINHCIKQSNYL